MHKMIRVFSRKCWTPDSSYPGGYAPCGSCRKTTIRVVATEDQAREICKPHNDKRPEYDTEAYFKFSNYEFEDA